jgi:hypothetical protein
MALQATPFGVHDRSEAMVVIVDPDGGMTTH